MLRQFILEFCEVLYERVGNLKRGRLLIDFLNYYFFVIYLWGYKV